MPDEQEEIWPLRHVFGTLHNLNMFAISIADGKGQIVCDESCKNNETSCAFLTTDEPGCAGKNIILGRRKEQPSYRAELGGMLGGILFVNRFCNTNGVNQGECELVCDCKLLTLLLRY